jgi:hypothetical protein
MNCNPEHGEGTSPETAVEVDQLLVDEGVPRQRGRELLLLFLYNMGMKYMNHVPIRADP